MLRTTALAIYALSLFSSAVGLPATKGIAAVGDATCVEENHALNKRDFTFTSDGLTLVRGRLGIATLKATTITRGGVVITRVLPVTTTTPHSASASPTGTTGPLVGSTFAQAALTAHNSYRAQHGAVALTWNQELSNAAQTWANKCNFVHSQGALGPWGENLAATAGYATTITDAVKMWTDESVDYNATNPVYSHFTQVVWKSTTQLGCAVAQCSGIFDPAYGLASFYVCEYNPPGNSGNADNYRANIQV
ncbi:hypothetical protein MNV49_000464 [Pseudohyphozyma bogoriensis]|nr:hypothetical protein MNV49_000464 [Pseudohyphozyma bogoriensis]